MSSQLESILVKETRQFLSDLEAKYNAERSEALAVLAKLGVTLEQAETKAPPARPAPRPVSPPANSAHSPMSAIEELAPTMEGVFRFSDLLSAIQARYPSFERESVRGAFRSYLGRPNCPVVVDSLGEGRAGNRYKRRPENATLPFPSAA